MSKYKYFTEYQSRQDLKEYGQNALSLYALQLYFNIESVESVAADSIVDGSDDKGLDLIYIDIEQKLAVIAQTYESQSNKKSAPEKKAQLLNYGIPLLLSAPVAELPDRLRASALELRAALSNNEIETIYIWYIHNLPGSKNNERTLRDVERTAKEFTKIYSGVKDVIGTEVSADILEKWYRELTVTINVNEKFILPIEDGFTMKGPDWEAFVTTVSTQWLFNLYSKFGQDLFSANVRDYLGVINRDQNINKGMQQTLEEVPDNFWVYNNGITILVSDYEVVTNKLKIEGLSILNGAQTTGAIGNLKILPDLKAKIQARFIKCNTKETIENIKRFNNSQNKIELSDFRSNDNIQKRLLEEFKNIKDINYSPRRGVVAIPVRKLNTLPSVLTGQLLAAFHGNPDVAYHQKTKIWQENALYSKYFNDASAKHIFLIYSLFETLRGKKLQLVRNDKKGLLKDIEKTQLSFFQTRGSIFLFISAIANCFEIYINTKVANKFRLEFGKQPTLHEAIKAWTPIVDSACFLASNLNEGVSDGSIRADKAALAIKKFTEVVGSTEAINKTLYAQFAKLIIN